MSLHQKLSDRAKQIEEECRKLYEIKSLAIDVCAVKREYSFDHLQTLYDAIKKLEQAIKESYEPDCEDLGHGH